MNRAEQLILHFFPHQPTKGQGEACRKIVDFLFDADPLTAFVLCGYAGTGKTSLVSALIKAAPHMKINTVLLAPTGRAAKVLSGYSGKKAYTIHKKIYHTVTDGSGMMRTTVAQNKSRYTLFIVDEASMISAKAEDGYVNRRSLLEDLVDYVNDGYHCRLMFIGDGAQLPPVGSTDSPALSPEYLHRMAGLSVYHAELTEVVRQQSESAILTNATHVRALLTEMEEGEKVEATLFGEMRSGEVIRLGGADLEETLNREYGEEGQEGVVVVCRNNKRANLYNQSIRNRVLYRDDEVGTGDYLMVVKNNYHWLEQDSEMGFIANGDIVEVMGARNYQEMYGFHFVDVTLRFVDYSEMPTVDCKLLLETLHSEAPSLTREEQQKLYSEVLADYADLPTKAERLNAVRQNEYYNALQVKFSYALTCHKTQGGQWPVVMVEQGYLTDEMRDRELLRWIYTAITRATKRLYLLNFEDSFFER